MNTADVIEKAADLIWLRGRCVGEREADDGRLCVRGAIETALGDKWYERMTYEEAVGRYLVAHPELLRDGVGYFAPFVADKGYYPPWVWNDHWPLTPENDELVIDTLRRCSKELRESA